MRASGVFPLMLSKGMDTDVHAFLPFLVLVLRPRRSVGKQAARFALLCSLRYGVVKFSGTMIGLSKECKKRTTPNSLTVHGEN
jgi:hypothetical protein